MSPFLHKVVHIVLSDPDTMGSTDFKWSFVNTKFNVTLTSDDGIFQYEGDDVNLLEEQIRKELETDNPVDAFWCVLNTHYKVNDKFPGDESR